MAQSFAVAITELPAIRLERKYFFLHAFSIILALLSLVTLYRLMRGMPLGNGWRWISSYMPWWRWWPSAPLRSSSPLCPGRPAWLQLPTQLPANVTAPFGPMPPLCVWLAGFVLLVGAGAAGRRLRSDYRQRPKRKLSLLEAEAQKARQALLDGQAVKDVILNCYQQMCLALQQEKGVERLVFMTTGDFERLLLDKGYPFEPIHRLTGLFEAVRYGHWQSGRSDEQAAITCLEAIIRFEGRLAKNK